MKYFFIILLSVGLFGHQFTPTYPELKYSYVSGVLQADMELYNAREDVSYYEVTVYDKDWNPMSFATTEKVSKVPYNTKKKIEVFIREKDKNIVTYICTESRIQPGTMTATFVSSRVCSKVRHKGR